MGGGGLHCLSADSERSVSILADHTLQCKNLGGEGSSVIF